MIRASGWFQDPGWCGRHSLQLNNPTDNTFNGLNWSVSGNVYGSPGLPNDRDYRFKPPEGRDTLLGNNAPEVVPWVSSGLFYHDADGHAMAAVAVLLASGPGQFSMGGSVVRENVIYPPADLAFTPAAPYTESSMLLYRFIDRSGQASQLHTVQFSDVTGQAARLTGGIVQWPNPVRDVCLFVFGGDPNAAYGGSAGDTPAEGGSVNFTLVDLTGKTVLHTVRRLSGNRLEIDLSAVNPGLYFYRLKAGDRTHAGKVQVVR